MKTENQLIKTIPEILMERYCGVNLPISELTCIQVEPGMFEMDYVDENGNRQHTDLISNVPDGFTSSGLLKVKGYKYYVIFYSKTK